MRHRLSIAVTVSLLAMILVLVDPWQMRADAQSPATRPAQVAREIGVAALGRTAYEDVGKIDQAGPVFTAYGYLTHIYGVRDDALFTNPISRTEATARVTFFATATLTSRSVISNVITIASTGAITYYLNNTPAGHFDDPASFAAGTPIATAAVRYQSILDVLAPDMGVASGAGELIQNGLTPFTLAGQRFRFGRLRLLDRISTFGSATRLEPTAPRSVIVFGGNAVIAGLPRF